MGARDVGVKIIGCQSHTSCSPSGRIVKSFGCQMIWLSIVAKFNWVRCQLIWASNDLVVDWSEIQVIWLSIEMMRLSSDLKFEAIWFEIEMIWLSTDLNFKWFGCQLIWEPNDPVVDWSELQVIWESMIWLSSVAFLRDFLQKRSFVSKSKLFCETSFKNEALKLKNEAFLRDFLQKRHVDQTLDLRITIRFSDFLGNASKVLRLPRKSWAEACEPPKLPREMITAK